MAAERRAYKENARRNYEFRLKEEQKKKEEKKREEEKKAYETAVAALRELTADDLNPSSRNTKLLRDGDGQNAVTAVPLQPGAGATANQTRPIRSMRMSGKVNASLRREG